MSVSLSPLAGAGWQFFDNNGVPLNGGLLYTYAAGTTTPTATYTSDNGVTANANPIVLDSSGRTPSEVWLTDGTTYKIAVYTSASVLIRTWDDIAGVNDSTALEATLASSTGSSMIGFIQAGTGAIARTAQAKMRDVVSVKDFGAVGDGVTNDTTAIQTALTAGTGKSVYFPAGSYPINTALSVPAGTYVSGQGVTVTQSAAGANAFTIAGDNVTIDGLKIVGINSLTTTASAVRADGRNNPTIINCTVNSFAWGVQLRGCTNARIEGNRFINGSYDASTSSDIFLYGDVTTPGRRTIIIGNHCLSNNDNGIAVDLLPGDRETIITGNVVAPCDSTGVQDIADVSNRRRNGIIVGYLGASGSRCVVSANIVRNASYGGIYMQGAASGISGDNAIVGNIVSRCSWGTAYPADASLRAGIHYAAGGSDSISNNVVVDCSNVGIKVSPDYALTLSTAPRAVFSGNVIARTAGSGMLFTNKPYGHLVTGNKIVASTSYGIQFQTTNSPADIGNCVFTGNHIEQISGSVAAMLMDSAFCTTYGNVVSNNKCIGVDSTTASIDNSGIYARGKSIVMGNHVQKFYYGVAFDETGSTRDLSWCVSNNYLVNCTVGILGAQGTGTRVATGNKYDTVTTKVSGCFDGLVVNDKLQVSGTAAPVANTWAVGDYLRRSDSAVGTPKGYYCTVAGTPGTWVSEGNL